MAKTGNVVDRALDVLGNGAASPGERMIRAVQRSGISERKWYRWRKAGKVTGREELFLLEDLTGIPARELAGLEGAPDGTGGERTPDAPPPGRTRSSAT